MQLREVLSPADEADFVRHFNDKHRFHIKAPPSDRFEPLFSWEAILARIEANGVPRDRLRLRRANGEVPPSLYRGRDPSADINVPALTALLKQKISVVIDGVNTLVPAVEAMATALERRLGASVWANAYASIGSGGAFPAHHDPHDVLVLQIRGRKYWRSFGKAEPSADPPSQQRAGGTVWEDWIEPGQILFLPRGEIHDARVESGLSVHLSYGIHSLTGQDVARYLASAAPDTEVLRQYLARSPAAAGGQLTALKNALHVLVDAISLDDVQRWDDETRALRAVRDTESLSPESPHAVADAMLRRRLPKPDPTATSHSFTAGGRKYTVTIAAARVLCLLVDEGPLPVADIAAALALDPGSTLRALSDLREMKLVYLKDGGTQAGAA